MSRQRWLFGPLAVLLLASLSHGYVQTDNYHGYGKNHWRQKRATLNLRLGCPAGKPCWDAVAREAAEEWNDAGSRFRFRFLDPSRPSTASCTRPNTLNTVLWAARHCEMAFGPNTLATTASWTNTNGSVVDSDVVFNTAFTWAVYTGPYLGNTPDFRRIALHEFGHILGLDHPDEQGQQVEAIMNAWADNTETLQPDDIAGVRAIYGRAPGPHPGDHNYCTGDQPCAAGGGDCDRDSECGTGLICVNDVGAQYGYAANVDVCEVGTRPDPDYCVGRTCGLGEGDCDPGQCGRGLVCAADVGAQYGLPAHYDVCEAGARPDPDYCVTNTCGIGDGDCDPGQCDAGVCVNDVGAQYGLPAHYDVCEAGTRPDPDYCVGRTCGAGEGDCDPGQCGAGLTCVNDVGARYGLPAHYDVCEATTPTHASDAVLNRLRGTWRVYYSEPPNDPFDVWAFSHVETIAHYRTLVGEFTNLDRIDWVHVALTKDVPVGQPVVNEYDYVALYEDVHDDDFGNTCEFLFFSFTTTTQFRGWAYSSILFDDGTCGNIQGQGLPATGVRLRGPQ